LTVVYFVKLTVDVNVFVVGRTRFTMLWAIIRRYGSSPSSHR